MSHFAKRHYEAIAQVMQETKPEPGYSREMVNWLNVRSKISDLFHSDNSRFDTDRFLHACLPGSNVKAKTAHLKTYQPKTGAKCSCRRGVQRDNCPNCEGTGMAVDFAAIRAMA